MSSPSLTLYTHGTIITVNKDREIILDGSILVDGSRIAAIGKSGTLKYKGEALPPNIPTVSLENKIVIPGLINTHAHLAQSLLRGLAEDLDLHSWLCDAIWPLEACYEGEDGYIAAKLTIAEMLKTGTTCFLEAMLTHRAGIENVVRAVGEMGVRACLAKLVKPIETNLSLNLTDARDKDASAMSVPSALAAHRTHHRTHNPLLSIWLSASTPRGSPLATHAAIGAAHTTHTIGVTMHCAEAPADLAIYRSQYSMSPLEFCARTGITGPQTVLAHLVHPDLAVDLEILSRTGTSVSHNPTSNAKLGNGIAPVPALRAGGANVCLGTDGAPCNNGYDMFQEMHLAGIIHSAAGQKAGAVSAYEVLEMATVNGARALGMEGEVGTLEVGKQADFVVVRPGIGASPWGWGEVGAGAGGVDPVTTVVHGCTGRDVEVVVVGGVVRVEGGELVGVDEERLMEEARGCVSGIRERSGVGSRMGERWGVKYV
ncbi:5-methylthioadenosine/S-adenosylhomocysteine deaminase n1 [Mytilinidion resinicola]|uniref:5-methylthioadenosine/S-adenosylhomocysteine deaminase n1 n=1 Tax=Mytilinidion resinicola TaxID=574789 RepID=A0A6A6YDV6_9PEZI|nr:5-methylthioadenosine/S-adenosylhomocysteine deaminase n1 [Mytilinidion resinicola]KAF2806996.1 5-methylthioadenosine/S-adenosylhomocysteine deaminase n1 [Mytilinidion resinicola]